MRSILISIFSVITLLLVVHPCLRDGMFLDGVNYANVASNLAKGQGTLWHFQFSETFLKDYTHQLPFMLWCEAVLFYLFGDGYLIERIFCLILYVLSATGIARCWRAAHPSDISVDIWPVTLWATIPIVFWGYANNVQEIMMSTCTIWSLYCWQNYRRRRHIGWLGLAGILCFLSAFCKGPQGLFPIAIPMIAYLAGYRQRIVKVVLNTALYTLPTIAAMTTLWLFQPGRTMLTANFTDRLQATFSSTTQSTTTAHHDIWTDTLAEVAVPLGIVLLLWLAVRSFHNRTAQLSRPGRFAILNILLGLAASLPLAVTLEQRRFYLITSMPFFALAIASWSKPLLQSIMVSKTTMRKVRWIVLITCCIALGHLAYVWDTPKRHVSMLTDVRIIGSQYQGQTIPADDYLVYEYSLIAYLARYYDVSLDFAAKKEDYPRVVKMGNRYQLQE